MPQLTVHLMGGFRAELDGETVYGFQSDKGRALLAYLMTEATPHRRETLAGLLWPDRPDTIAAPACDRRSLVCGECWAIQRSPDPVTPPFLFVTPTDVQFNTHSPYTLDVAELEGIARSPRANRKVLRLNSAATCSPVLLCRTEVLPGLAAKQAGVLPPRWRWTSSTNRPPPSSAEAITCGPWRPPACSSRWNPGWRRLTAVICALAP